MTTYTYGEEIPWTGGECPVDENDLIMMMNRRGAWHFPSEASLLDWRHEGMGSDIIAYRVATPINREQEIARLRVALERIVERSENGTLGTSKVQDMARIAREALEGGVGE